LAWAMLQQQPFDVLFTDVSLPGMSGIELARKALGQQRLRIVFSTGFGRDALAQIGFPAAVLRKPYELDELKAVLDADL
jgi:CheY-like chemotaxis protein